MTALFEAVTLVAAAAAVPAAPAAATTSRNGAAATAAAAAAAAAAASVGLQGSNEPVDTPSHLAFYLFALQQLSYPASIAGLFSTESNSDDTPVLVKEQVVQDASRAVFR
jgi:type V secretory pathway adhesin AidA